MGYTMTKYEASAAGPSTPYKLQLINHVAVRSNIVTYNLSLMYLCSTIRPTKSSKCNSRMNRSCDTITQSELEASEPRTLSCLGDV